MGTDLQSRNIAYLFQVWDTNDTGELTWADYEGVVDRLISESGQPAGGDAHGMLTDVFKADWAELTKSADKDANGSITPGEWNAYHVNMVSTDDGYQVAVDSFAEVILRVVDSDQDGVVSKSDYGKIFTAFNIDPGKVDEAFDKLDSDDDGKISADELRQAAKDYFRPASEDAPGNWLFGSPA